MHTPGNQTVVTTCEFERTERGFMLLFFAKNPQKNQYKAYNNKHDN